MLGHTLLYELSKESELHVWGTVRSRSRVEPLLPKYLHGKLIDEVDALKIETVENAVRSVAPDVVLNAVGVIPQLSQGRDALSCIELNARFPHLLAGVANEVGARFIQFSTDCVFDGKRGAYAEEDNPTAYDNYGMSKFLGEIREPPALTLRTSIIGHELQNKVSLLEWFLRQSGEVRGFDKAIYSGFPTVEVARILTHYVLSDKSLVGLYHVASAPISKYDLLKLFADVYGLNLDIRRDSSIAADKSLRAEKFAAVTGYHSPDWRTLIEQMRDQHIRFQQEF